MGKKQNGGLIPWVRSRGVIQIINDQQQKMNLSQMAYRCKVPKLKDLYQSLLPKLQELLNFNLAVLADTGRK